MLKKSILSVLATLMLLSVFGQVTIQFVPEVYGRNINGLFNCKILSVNQRFAASLTVTVNERKGGTVCVLRSSEFNIVPGNNLVPVSAARSAAIQFANNKLGQVTSQSRTFPAGDYDYCFELKIRNSDIAPFEQCFSYNLAPFTELSLIDPFNKDSVCNKRPVFSWQPLIPAIAGSYYQLVLTEIKTGQNATEALNYNLSIVNQRSIVAPLLPYPAIAKELVAGKKYAWQVTAYKEQTILNRSEIWEFTVNCRDSVKKETEVDGGYRDIEDLTHGNYYVAYGKVKFIVVNSYDPQALSYELYPVIGGDRKLKHLPKIKLDYGKNKVVIDLEQVSGLVLHQYYILNVLLPDGERKSVRFLYEKAK